MGISLVGYIKIQGTPTTPKAPLGPKVTALLKFTCKKISLHQILPASLKKIKFLLFKEIVHVSFRQEITIGKCKAKAIQTALGTVRHNQAYPGVVRHIRNPV